MTVLYVFLGLVGAFVLVAAIYMPFVIADAHKTYNDKCDYIILLGGHVIGAATPSPNLKQRMVRAARYLKENPHVYAVPSGGCFRKGQKKSEAAIIAEYLIEQGIHPDRIILEENATTTYENFIFALPLIKEHSGINPEHLRIAFLSSSYHLHRSALIAEDCGIKKVLRVTAPTYPGFSCWFREYCVAYEVFVRRIVKMIKK